MDNLGEEAEAFFRSGDEGTYQGGPASIVPFELCEDAVEDPPLDASEEVLERRRKLKRWVATIVAALSAGLVVLLAGLFVGAQHPAEHEDAASRSVQAQPVITPPATPPAQAVFRVAPQIVATPSLPESVRTAEVAPSDSRPEKGAIAPREATFVKRAVPVRAIATARQWAVPHESRRTTTLVPARGSIDFPSVPATFSVRHTPPTASFPE